MVTTPLEGDLGWMLGVVFRAYAKAADHALSDLPGGPRRYQVLSAAVGEPPRNQGAIGQDLGIRGVFVRPQIGTTENLRYFDSTWTATSVNPADPWFNQVTAGLPGGPALSTQSPPGSIRAR